MDNGYFNALTAPLPEDIEKLKWRGDFRQAAQVIDRRLKKDIPSILRKRLMLEKEILKRLPGQYPYSWEEALEILKKNVRDFQDGELTMLWEEDAADWIYVDGQVRFRSSFLKNVLKTRPEFERRALDPELVRSKALNVELLDETIKAMKAQKSLGYRFRIRGTLSIKEESKKDEGAIRVYLPLPIEYSQITNTVVHRVLIGDREAREDEYTIGPADAPQRTICFHTVHRPGQKYTVEYSFENHMTYRDLSQCRPGSAPETFPDRRVEREAVEQEAVEQETVEQETMERECPAGDGEPAPEDREEQPPHIRFTPLIRELADELTAEEKNPLGKARRIYDYITTHVMYSFVRSYFTLTDIVQYAAASQKGDCGVQALMFITLCRAAGIPARWQSGLYATRLEIGCHDWAQFYVEPYGWLYADCSFGGAAWREGRKERWDFYFGNLEPFRMPAAREFAGSFEPPMKHLRNDPYDNQMGEAEYGDRSLLEEEYSTEYEMIQLVPLTY